ncbi:hypothetical protein PVAP13_5KG098487 [Panicum virgatum]|uniref:AP2/ERF domain-containing protein n=1 Tax=Panicum virgatum TaxID=38727 RepID=A0A8T0SC39_PANVG|nr:hypothetical protein PVAP13_5KG098487 [Panicum virgatum]
MVRRLRVAFAALNSSLESGGADELAALHLLSRQPSSFKGVVPQPNGRWGAQIYDRHARVWLGTFPDEEIAARAYDVSAVRYCGREAITNFPGERASAGELAFLAAHSKSEIVDMLRKHTYAAELRQGLRRGRGMGARAQPTPLWARKLLFEKVVTPAEARAGEDHRQGRAPQFRGRRGQGVAVPVLVLEQQPELRAYQGLEPLRQGEGPPSRRHRGFLPASVWAAGQQSAAHQL